MKQNNSQNNQKQPTKSEPQPKANNGKIQIVDYSEKAIAVIGETKQHKDKLKRIGKFQSSFKLRRWVGIQQKRLEDVKAYF